MNSLLLEQMEFNNNEKDFIARLRRGEEQVKKGEVTDENLVLQNMRKKYNY